jgi:hypothetical protein
MKKLLWILTLLCVVPYAAFAARGLTAGKKVVLIGKDILSDWGITYSVDGGEEKEVVVPPNSFKLTIFFDINVTFYTKKPSSHLRISRDGCVVDLSANLGMPVWVVKVLQGDESKQSYVPEIFEEYWGPDEEKRCW